MNALSLLLPILLLAEPVENPAIDMPGYLAVAHEAARHRETRRIPEAEFIRMSGESGTIVLDARSREKYDELHVAGAVSLPFPDITIESVARLIPDPAPVITATR